MRASTRLTAASRAATRPPARRDILVQDPYNASAYALPWLGVDDTKDEAVVNRTAGMKRQTALLAMGTRAATVGDVGPV